MPSEWIKQKAERERTETARIEREQAKQLREAEMIKALGPAFVKRLMDTINEDLTQWNAEFKDRQINGASAIHSGFTFAKLGFPRGSAEVKFNPDMLRIEIFMRRTTADGSGEYDHEGFFYLEVSPEGKDVHMLDRMRRGHVTPADFSKIMLESIAELTSSHSF